VCGETFHWLASSFRSMSLVTCEGVSIKVSFCPCISKELPLDYFSIYRCQLLKQPVDMMVQSRKPKLSSRSKRLLADALTNASAYSEAILAGDSDVVNEARLFETYASRKLLLEEMANLRDGEGAIQRFWRRWAGRLRPEWTPDLLSIRNDLRTVWQQPYSAKSEGILNEWVSWVPTPDHLQAYEDSGFRAARPAAYLSFKCSIKACRLVPDFLSLRSMLVQGIFENWQHFKTCTNPGCPAPYFVAKRRDQTVCNASDCKAAKQREHALKWWRNRPKNASTKPVKGRSRNGSSKAK
jgi:hypothetical protein